MAAAIVQNDVFETHTPITLGFLRNGTAADVVRTSRESSITSKYFYRGLRWIAAYAGNAEARAPPCPVPVILEAQIRSAFAGLVEDSVDTARTAHATNNAAGVFDAAASRADARANAALKLEAITLGSAHSALLVSYHVIDADLRAPECENAVFNLVAPAPAVDAAAYATTMRTITAGWMIALASGHSAVAATDLETSALSMPALTADQLDLAYAFVSMGQVAPVRAGAQLFVDGHHYHSDADSSARHRAIEREVIGRVTTAARNLWRANTAMMRNAVWHASIHVVLTSRLEEWAEDDDMPERLDATGYGSMSVGLPAQEDLFNRAGSYVAVYNKVYQTASAHGHEISIDDMITTVETLRRLPRRGALPAVRPVLPGHPASAWPTGCNTRTKALKAFLIPALDKAEPVAAWMFGYYREICSRSGVRSSSQEGSLLRSYSLQRAVANFVGEANRAQEMYSARARWVRNQAEEGNLETYVGRA